MRKAGSQQHGFTIVELLVVIVVIGILAAITIVSYTGISQKAVLASLQSDLSTSAQRLKMYQVEHGAYPQSLDGSNCPTGPADTQYCLKPSPGNTFAYSSSSPYTSFSLVATNVSGISYQVTDNSKPTALVAAPLNPVADWLATAQGDHYGNYYDLVSHGWASVTRTTPKTIYDPNDGRIHDVPADYLAMNPWSAYQAGGRGSAAVIEEARTNYLTNSYGAANDGSKWTTGWNRWDTAVGTPTNSIVPGLYGSTAQRTMYVGTVGDSGADLTALYGTSAVGSFAAGEAATVSLWVKTGFVGCGGQVEVTARDSGGASLGTVSAVFTGYTLFTRVTKTYSSLPANTSFVTVNVYGNNIHNTDVWDATFDAAQLEKGTFATSYIPTTTTAVTRNADVVTVPTTGWNAAAGTMAAVGAKPSATTGNLVSWDDSGFNNRVLLYSSSGTDIVLLTKSGGGSNLYDNKAMTSSPAVFAGTWSGGEQIRAYTDGVSGVRTDVCVAPAGLPATAWIGLEADANHFNGSLQRVTIYPSALSSSDVTTVTNAVKNGP
jgi:prepilin-type N-terminal cleavage/methylation domain-containing protein